jgi:hypothetical protein
MAFHTKAADGTTDIYGMLFRPTNFDPNRKYPIINQIYPGPQSGSVGSRAWSLARGDRQALAELGFIVVSIDGRGTPGRSKAFHDAYYGAMGRDNTIPDQIAAMKELAARHSWIDIDRAPSGATRAAGSRRRPRCSSAPDFWKVGIAESGNHDQRNMRMTGANGIGARSRARSAAPTTTAVEAGRTSREDLRASCCSRMAAWTATSVSNTMLVVDALVRATELQLIIFPNAGHLRRVEQLRLMRRRGISSCATCSAVPPPTLNRHAARRRLAAELTACQVMECGFDLECGFNRRPAVRWRGVKRRHQSARVGTGRRAVFGSITRMKHRIEDQPRRACLIGERRLMIGLQPCARGGRPEVDERIVQRVAFSSSSAQSRMLVERTVLKTLRVIQAPIRSRPRRK